MKVTDKFEIYQQSVKDCLNKNIIYKDFMLETVQVFQWILQKQNLLNFFPFFSQKKIKEKCEAISLTNKFGTTSDLDMYPNITKICETHQTSKKQQSNYLGSGKYSNFTDIYDLLQYCLTVNFFSKKYGCSMLLFETFRKFSNEYKNTFIQDTELSMKALTHYSLYPFCHHSPSTLYLAQLILP